MLRCIVVVSLAMRAQFHLPGLPMGATGAVDTQGSRRASHEALVALAKVEASMGAGMGVGGAAEPPGSRAGARWLNEVQTHIHIAIVTHKGSALTVLLCILWLAVSLMSH